MFGYAIVCSNVFEYIQIDLENRESEIEKLKLLVRSTANERDGPGVDLQFSKGFENINIIHCDTIHDVCYFNFFKFRSKVGKCYANTESKKYSQTWLERPGMYVLVVMFML